MVLAKWLMTEPQILMLNDPTRGIDVGTKQELYQLLRRLADAGTSILFYSTDYDELIGCCDRVLILYQGRIVRELAGQRHHRDQHRGQLAQHPNDVVRPSGGGGTVKDWKLKLGQAQGLLVAIGLFLAFYGLYSVCTRAGSPRPCSGRTPTSRSCW